MSKKNMWETIITNNDTFETFIVKDDMSVFFKNNLIIFKKSFDVFWQDILILIL